MKTLERFFDLLFKYAQFKYELRCNYVKLKAEYEVYVAVKKHEIANGKD